MCTKNYPFTNDAPWQTLHFTQLVWEASTELGIGMSKGRVGRYTCVFVVGRYRKKGNWHGAFQKNVPKGSFTRSICSSLDKMVKDARAEVAKGSQK